MRGGGAHVHICLVRWHTHPHHFVVRIAQTTRRETVPCKAGLIAVCVEEDQLIEHPIEMLFAIELYLEVVHLLLDVVYGSNIALIEAVVVVSRPPAVWDDQPETH
jgi:hypothetical protein